jgi:hypothetical protein
VIFSKCLAREGEVKLSTKKKNESEHERNLYILSMVVFRFSISDKDIIER